ncbi:MAG: BT4734/BF3469 family protein, partial [bacterium]
MNQVITPIKIGNVSVFEPPISNTIPLKEVSLYDIFTVIKSQKLAETTNELRSAAPDKAKEIKLKKLHYFTPNGTFSKRANTALKQASNLLVIDLDNLEPDELANIKAEIVSDFEPVLMFISPSGMGLKIIYYIDLTVGSHLQYFHALREYFSQRLNLEIDESGKDVARACFLCHDPDAFYSETPTVLRREFLDTFHVDESPKQTVQQTPSPISENEIIRRMDTWCHKNFTYVKGNRNNFITQLSGALHRAGVSEFDALNHCRGYAESDFTQKEIETTVRSIYRNSAFSGKNPLHQEREVTSFKGEVTSHMPRITGETEDSKKVVTGNLVTTQKFKIPEFPVDAFPEKVRNIILTLNEKQGFPVDFSAAAVLFACAVCSGNNYSLKIKNGWSEKPILYIVIVGKRGTMKTHPVNWYLKPIHERDGEKHKQFERAEAIYKENMELPRDERESIEQPILTQTLLSDYTIEAINEAHQNNPKGLGVHRDEVAGLVNDFNNYTGGRGSEQQV